MEQTPDEQDRGAAGERFSGPVLVMTVVLFAATFAAQALVVLLWPGSADPVRWLVFSGVFAALYATMSRPWLRVGTDGLSAGSGPTTRARLALDEVRLARPHDGSRPEGWRWWRRDERHTDLYPGWGPAVAIDVQDGRRVVVAVTDRAAVLSALQRVGVPVSDRSR